MSCFRDHACTFLLTLRNTAFCTKAKQKYFKWANVANRFALAQIN